MDPAVAARVRSFSDLGTASRALAQRVVGLARGALSTRGRCGIGLSGGSTPEALFGLFSTELRSSVEWERLDYFWADERAVPPSDPRSNFGLAQREWLGSLTLPDSQVHRIRGEAETPEEAAAEYEAALRGYRAEGRGAEAPLFDILLLGIGRDGHTASLFPGSPTLSDSSSWALVERHPALEPFVPRISLGLAALNRSRFVGFLVAGAEKREALLRVLRTSTDAELPPCGLVHGLESTEWFVDREALGPDDLGPATPSAPSHR